MVDATKKERKLILGAILLVAYFPNFENNGRMIMSLLVVSLRVCSSVCIPSNMFRLINNHPVCLPPPLVMCHTSFFPFICNLYHIKGKQAMSYYQNVLRL
jgi:hypothetical protein